MMSKSFPVVAHRSPASQVTTAGRGRPARSHPPNTHVLTVTGLGFSAIVWARALGQVRIAATVRLLHPHEEPQRPGLRTLHTVQDAHCTKLNRMPARLILEIRKRTEPRKATKLVCRR